MKPVEFVSHIGIHNGGDGYWTADLFTDPDGSYWALHTFVLPDGGWQSLPQPLESVDREAAAAEAALKAYRHMGSLSPMH